MMLEVSYKSGFYDPENDGVRDFRWGMANWELSLPEIPEKAWLYCQIGYPGQDNTTLSLCIADTKYSIPIKPGWRYIGIDISALAGKRDVQVTANTNYIHAAPGDTRQLSLMIGHINIGEPDKRIINDIYYAEDFMTNTLVRSYPEMLLIEPTNRCNLSCVMCSSPFKNKNKFADINMHTIYKLEDAVDCAKLISLILWGEPFLYKYLFDILHYIQCRGNQYNEINTTTNATLLTPEIINSILNSCLSFITISLDAATEPTYKKIRQADFSKVIANITNLVAQRNQRGSKLEIGINMTVMRENLEEVVEFVRLAHRLGVDRCHIKPIVNRPGYIQGGVKGGWGFYYPQQMLEHYPGLTGKMHNLAVAEARKLGVNLIHEAQTSLSNIGGAQEEDLPYPLELGAFKAKQASPSTPLRIFPGKACFRHAVRCDNAWSNAVIEAGGDVHFCCLLSGITPPPRQH